MTEIKRYQEYSYGVEETVIGEFVKYDDHAAIVAERDVRIAELESGDVGGALMQRELHHASVVSRIVKEVAALQEQVRSLADENANLKVACGGDGNYIDCPGCSHSQYIESPETPETDAVLREIRAQARAEGIHFAANRLLAAWESGFIDDTPAAAHDISGAILSAIEFLPNADEGEFKREYADEVRARIRSGEQP